MVAFLQRMGVPVFEGHRQLFLNSYFAALVRFARQACGERWIAVLQAAGYEALLEEEPPDDNERTIPIGAASRLAEAIEYVFGPAAPETLRQWGRLTSEFWITKTQQLQEGSVTYMKPLRGFLSSTDRKVEDILYITSHNTNQIQNKRLTA